MKVKNYMEIVVNNFLEDILENYQDLCHCEKCIADIKAIALNSLPPKYVASEVGEVYSKIDALSIPFEVNIINTIIKAINIVKESPKH